MHLHLPLEFFIQNNFQNAARWERPGKPKPPLKPKPFPLVEAMFPYEAQDTDELSFVAGDRFELVNKGYLFTEQFT